MNTPQKGKSKVLGERREAPLSPIHAASKWMPAPSSVEEAAALLGASITRVNDVHVYGTFAPPKGLHSSFTTVKPVPCSELYVRLSSLTNLLQSHIDKDKNATIEAAPSIIPLLHKLFHISSSLALTPILLHSSSSTIPAVNPLQSIAGTASTPKKKPRSQASSSNHNSNSNMNSPPSPRPKNLQVPPVRITPPLCSQPIRHQWVQCLTLAHRLSPAHALPSTNPHVLLAPYFQSASGHPRSAKSAGGARVAALAIMTSIFDDEILGAKYVRPLLPEVITLCHNGLRSSGATDVVHRVHSVRCALSAIMAWRDAPSPIVMRNNDSAQKIFISESNRVEEKVLAECARLLKKASSDHYPEVRLAAAELATVLSSMLLVEEPRGRSSKKEYNLLVHSDEVMAICLRNLDDESVGVSVAWSEALARCICTAVEYHSLSDKTQAETNADSLGSGNKNDFTAKLKATLEARRAVGTIGSQSCFTLESAMIFLVQQFAKVGGEGAYKLGGSHSMGGRHAQVGISLAIIELCKLQLQMGGIGSSSEKECLDPSVALKIIMKMVPTEEKEDAGDPMMIQPSLSQLDDSIFRDATSSPKRKKQAANPIGVGGFLRNMSGGITEASQKLPTDACLARLTTSRVLRSGLSGMMSETMQQTILRDLATLSRPNKNKGGVPEFNRHQLQVAMVEISHLVTALGEASASCLEELLPAMQYCLSDADHGVRHEAAVAFQAITLVFPSAGRKYIMTMVGEVQVNQDEVLALGAKSGKYTAKADTTPRSQNRRNRRRQAQEKEDNFVSVNSTIGASLNHQYAIHGNALVLSMILHVMPQLPGGLPAELLDIIIAVADNLVSCQGNANLMKYNPGALVTCVRAGYHIISGALTMGPKATVPHLQKVFGIWSRSATLIDEETNKLEPSQSVSCVEPFIASILVFLQKNSEMLLSVPDALNRTIQILEKLFPIILGYSQIEGGDSKAFASTRLDSAKAAIIEAFAWLPPGSFPTISSSVFSFASRQIQVETKRDFSCTILNELLSNEDNILTSRASTRTEQWGQTGNAAVEDNVIMLKSTCIRLSEREAVLHLVTGSKRKNRHDSSVKVSVPTPLHEVGAWSFPPVASRSSKERLMNSSIHIFAATFSSLDGHQQTGAIKMLDELLESKLASKGINVCARNVAATLLSCLKALPPPEISNITSNDEVPAWISLAAKSFVTILPIPDNHARRAAAEGLGLLSALNSASGTNKLQSSILRALEQLMIIEVSDISAQQRPHMPTPASSSAGCLLTFACIQRSFPAQSKKEETEPTDNSFKSINGTKVGGVIPTMIMMTRLLPYIAAQEAEDDSHISRTYALYSFYLLLSYSKIIECESVSLEERRQILAKAVEVVESNFYAAWTSNDTEVDIRSLENEKAAFEPALLAVLVRLMTYLIPRLRLLRREDGSAASRFSSMVDLMVKKSNFHVSVVLESLIFFECLSAYTELLSLKHLSVTGTGNAQMSILSISTGILNAQQITNMNSKSQGILANCRGSIACLRKAISSVTVLLKSTNVTTVTTTEVISHLFGLLQGAIGSGRYLSSPLFRVIASPLQAENEDSKWLLLELRQAIEAVILFNLEDSSLEGSIHWLLVLRSIINGDNEISGNDDDLVLRKVVNEVFEKTGPCRWQLRCETAMICKIALDSFHEIVGKNNLETDEEYLQPILPHIGSFVGTSCAICIATNNESELFAYQKIGLGLLHSLIRRFASFTDPAHKNVKLLDEFVSQIIPCMKHALSYDIEDAEDSIDTEGARELYLSGCECFQVLAKEGLIPDLAVLKRLLKTVLPSGNILAFSPYPNEGDADLHGLNVKPTSFVDNRTSVLLPRIGSLWTVAELYIAGEMGLLKTHYFETIKSDLNGMEDVVAINSAALAIDARRLKEVYRTVESEGSEPSPYEMKSALTFLNKQDIDVATKDAMMKSCTSLACFALILLLKLLETETESSDKYSDLKSWMGRLIDVILVELYELFDGEAVSNMSEGTSVDILAPCLLVLRIVVEGSADLLSTGEIHRVLHCLFQVIKFTGLTSKDEKSEEKVELGTEVTFPIHAISEACTFVEVICKPEKANAIGTHFLLKRVMTPLLETEDSNHEVFVSHTSNVKVLISLLKSSRSLIEGPDVDTQVARALLIYALENIGLASICDDLDLRDSFHDLIKHCISIVAVSDDERHLCADKMAKIGNWDTWKLCINSDLIAVANSMPYVKIALSDHSNESSHAGALTSIADMMKDCPDLVPTIFGSIGPHVLELFHLCGTYQLQGSSRTMSCATCMKIVMFTFQYLLSPQSTDGGKEAAFLNVVFGVLVEIVTYNGLPNNLKSNPGSDPALGRMCAQFFVHVLRSSPAAFKQCMTNVDVTVRATLESSVRADMSGYASRAAPIKKKLNLKSYKK